MTKTKNKRDELIREKRKRGYAKKQSEHRAKHTYTRRLDFYVYKREYYRRLYAKNRDKYIESSMLYHRRQSFQKRWKRIFTMCNSLGIPECCNPAFDILESYIKENKRWYDDDIMYACIYYAARKIGIDIIPIMKKQKRISAEFRRVIIDKWFRKYVDYKIDRIPGMIMRIGKELELERFAEGLVKRYEIIKKKGFDDSGLVPAGTAAAIFYMSTRELKISQQKICNVLGITSVTMRSNFARLKRFLPF